MPRHRYFCDDAYDLDDDDPVAQAASHREAPLIALDPAADNTDTYVFRSWQDPNKVVFIMNVIPGQDPADGPNYFNFDDDAVYRFSIDNDRDGDAEDIIYEFRFQTENRPIFGQLEFPLAYVGRFSIYQCPNCRASPGSTVPALKALRAGRSTL